MNSILAVLLLLVTSLVALPKTEQLPQAQAELVAAERAFAKLSVERGVRESFVTYFAADGIGFRPHPYKVKEVLSNLPAPPTRSLIVLNWAPIYGDISRAGDLGYNIGPTLSEDRGPDKNPSRNGMFFSVWKRQSDGNWRVVLDLGVPTPNAVAPLDTQFTTAYRNDTPRPALDVNVDEEIAKLLTVEREFMAAARTGNVGQAYKLYLSGDARVHRQNTMPLFGETALRIWLASQTMTLTGEPIKADVARSGELGYAYGSYEVGGAHNEKGYYARVWKRDGKGRWRIVVDVTQPTPPGQ